MGALLAQVTHACMGHDQACCCLLFLQRNYQ